MPFAAIVTPGHIFQAGVPYDEDDLNAAARPSVSINGAIGTSDIPAGAIQTTHVLPGPYFHAVATGAAGAYAVTLSPPVASLVDGLWLSFQANHTNAGAVTLNVNALGAKDVVGPAGEALTGGEIASGQKVWVQYDGTRFRMVSQAPKPRVLWQSNDTGSANAYAITLGNVVVTSLAGLTGVPIAFVPGNTNSGASTLAVNGLAPVAIRKRDFNTELEAGDIVEDQVVVVVFDGLQFRLLSPEAVTNALPEIITAGTYNFPSSVQVDATGRVLAISGGSLGGVYTEAKSVPNRGSAEIFTHGLGRVPMFVEVRLVMGSTTELGYAEGDEVHHSCASQVYGTPLDYFDEAFTVTISATQITVAHNNDGTEFFRGKSGATLETWTPAHWTLKVIAW